MLPPRLPWNFPSHNANISLARFPTTLEPRPPAAPTATTFVQPAEPQSPIALAIRYEAVFNEPWKHQTQAGLTIEQAAVRMGRPAWWLWQV